ncbi:uncharacterized protein M421DRAFT_412960 [Didymella exigua CBS 183.55]|uniref:Uncharacterized protein n=1 Tax=Didymella exigua CBS 183.55 TaxID=1150837 RepID=A0A6A5R6G4_9PLEO|nr:uncharacterized protein M421DRAFT_412960 [Didymella exigua CBS 183.55]KAF1922326.1 hypothetical protein M421DRAFT_412960 [Didymella exigua CBS 183.55]
MISVGIFNGAGPTGARRRLPRYRLFALIVGICLAVITGSHFSHVSHSQQPSDVQKRSLFDESLRLNNSLVSLPQGLFSRAANEALWARKVASGRGYLLILRAVSGSKQRFYPSHLLTTRTAIWCMMNSNDVVARTVTLETLLSAGWEEDDEQDEAIPADYRKSLGRADGLLNTANEVSQGWDHVNIWTGDDGRERNPTTATMGNIVNGDDGYIIAGGNFGPAETTKDLEDPLPKWMWPTTKWTDIMAVSWGQYAAGKDLKRVYRSAVVMPETKALMESALLKVNKLPGGDLDDLPQWPGVDIVPGRTPTKMPMTPAVEAFMGLLGSSHGAGPAYLVIQYWAIFGKKRINKIKIWRSENKPVANMLLYMESL